jgi:hypothetical protein
MAFCPFCLPHPPKVFLDMVVVADPDAARDALVARNFNKSPTYDCELLGQLGLGCATWGKTGSSCE